MSLCGLVGLRGLLLITFLPQLLGPFSLQIFLLICFRFFIFHLPLFVCTGRRFVLLFVNLEVLPYPLPQSVM